MKWEYRVELLDPDIDPLNEGLEGFAAALNALGQEGWELVSVGAKTGLKLLAFLKRPISN